MPLQTPETPRQLRGDFFRAFRKLAKSMNGYLGKSSTERVVLQEEVLNLFHYLDGLMKQMTVKIVNHSRSDAIAIANEALKNPKKRKDGMSKLLKLDHIFKRLQVDAGDERRMSAGIGNLASGVRNQINPIIGNTQTQLTQIARREQQAEKQLQQQRIQEKKNKGSKRGVFGFGKS